MNHGHQFDAALSAEHRAEQERKQAEREACKKLEAAAPYLYETAKEFIAGWSHFCDCIDFGKSFLDAKAIQFMNEVPAKIATGIVKAEEGV